MRSVIITGANRGIGYDTALAFGRAGYKVYATMRNPETATALKQKIEEESLSIVIAVMDVNSDESVKKCIDAIYKENDSVDVLVNNAGIEYHGSVEETNMPDFKAVMETNYFGVLRCIKAVLSQMRNDRNGCIINVTSVAGKISNTPLGPYTASKHALEAISECLAQEVKPFNIQIAIVEPEVIETPIFKKANEISGDTNYPNIKRFFAFFAASIENHIPPSVVAAVIDDIVSGKSTRLRNTAGPTAEGLMAWRTSLADEDWVSSAAVDEETWANNMAQMGLDVKKHMQLEGALHF